MWMSTLLFHLSRCRKPMHTSGEQLWYINPTWTALESGHHGASRQVRTNLLPGAFFRLALSLHETLLSIGKRRDLHFTASNCDLILCFYKRCKYCTLTFCNVAYVSVHIKYLLSSTLNLKEKRFVALFFWSWEQLAGSTTKPLGDPPFMAQGIITLCPQGSFLKTDGRGCNNSAKSKHVSALAYHC